MDIEQLIRDAEGRKDVFLRGNGGSKISVHMLYTDSNGEEWVIYAWLAPNGRWTPTEFPLNFLVNDITGPWQEPIDFRWEDCKTVEDLTKLLEENDDDQN